MADADDALQALWQAAESDFAADAPNRAFIEHCRVRGELPEAARRYREAKESAAGTGEAAAAREAIQKRLAAVALIAMSEIEARKSQPAPRRSHPLTIAFAA